jgi:LDH2 family malate/lactate/ureidoglycolate dehydrogenase
MDIALEKATQHGVAVAAAVECHHVGRLGHYAETAAAHGAISFIMLGGLGREAPAAVPYGGRKPALHTNPVAMGFPGKEGSPMVFDFATTGVSGVKVINAQRRGYLLPVGLVVDKDGNPTQDPQVYADGGAMLPFGGHKGYALMLATEFLGRVFTTAETFADPAHGGPVMRNHGTTMVVFRADLFQPLEDYRREAQQLQEQIRETPPAPGFTEVLVPGDPERRAREKRLREGIPVEADVWEQIVEIAHSLDLPIEIPGSEPVSPSHPEA